METQEEIVVSTIVSTLECGCYTELVNGRHINFLCDEHEEEYQTMLVAPVYFKKTRMREEKNYE